MVTTEDTRKLERALLQDLLHLRKYGRTELIKILATALFLACQDAIDIDMKMRPPYR